MLVDALDAALLTRWGPDDAAERATLAQRITLAAAHIRRHPTQRSTAALWRLIAALEALDSVAVLRALRVLDGLAEETGDPRERFFADSRRAMYALAAGDSCRRRPTDRLHRRRRRAGGDRRRRGRVRSLASQREWQAGDRAALAREAALFERFGLTEAIPSILAEAAVFWCGAGELGRAGELLDGVVGDSLAAVPRDVDWLLTVTMLVRVALAVSRPDIVAQGVELLAPYPGHAVLNAGAVTFHGVVADVLSASARLLGDDREESWREHAADGYRRLGARWWLAALRIPGPAPATQRMLLRRSGDRLWTVGDGGVLDGAARHAGPRLPAHPAREPGRRRRVARACRRRRRAPDTDAGELIDDQARAAYRRRLADLESELDEAVAWSDPGVCDAVDRRA